MTDVEVRCDRGGAEGWTCLVTLGELERRASTHTVRVSMTDLERLTPGAADPTTLVEQSFAFLLERESPGSILRSFNLLDIARYFPDYESDIRRRVGGA